MYSFRDEKYWQQWSRLAAKVLYADMLDIIQTNPYRLLGIYSNSPTKERVANYNRLKAFLKVGKPVSFQLDFSSLLPTVNRTAETVAEAGAKLALPNEQLRYAQFWFAKVTPMDDIAMNHLIAGNMENAMSIWEKKENASSLQNRIVCALIQNDYTVAFACADKLYSLYSADFANMVLGENHTVITEKLEYGFLDELCLSVGAQQILPYLSLNDEWKQYVGNKSVRPLIESLHSAVNEAKSSRGKEVKERLAAGTKLMNDTKATLMQLKTLLSVSDLQYQMIADELGLEIMQCGIDYYNGPKVAEAAYEIMELQSYALSIVVGKMAKDRCRANADELQKIIDDLPPAEVLIEDKAIQEELRKFTLLGRISHAVTLLNNAKPHLHSMKNKLGVGNAYYLKLSTQVVGNALRKVIQEVNAVQNSVLLKGEAPIRSTLRAAWNAIEIMDTFDMELDFRTNYNQNRSILKSICDRLGVPTTTKENSDKWGGTITLSCVTIGVIIGAIIGGVMDGAISGAVLGGSLGLVLAGKIIDNKSDI